MLTIAAHPTQASTVASRNRRWRAQSAAGPDLIPNEALRNLNDGAIADLTRYYNRCWLAGELPQQWKTARTVLISKPGKPPSIDNLRPISLTSCVGKILEHVLKNRWQRYLESEGLYPEAMLGFRERLSTQDAMLMLRHEIIDRPVHSQDNRAVSSLGFGQCSYDYIREFPTGRTAKIQAGDLQLEERELGSLLSEVPQVRHSIYADEITLWFPGGSNGHIEDTLQAAINTIEDHLDSTGLVCSPQKSELQVIPLPGRNRKQALVGAEEITLHTRDGTVIPRVQVLRVLGMLLEASGGNTATVNRLTTKIGAASCLIKRVAT
ncbi:uncharacterized protein LOC144160730 [Haemaphysalis longicornis]